MGKRANLVKANQTPLKQNLNVLFTDHYHRYQPGIIMVIIALSIHHSPLLCSVSFSHFYHGRCYNCITVRHISV